MKKFITKLLGYFGYGIIKINRASFFKKDVKVQVGRYSLSIPSINPLAYTYNNDHDFSSEIGRIMLCVYDKYPELNFIDIGANIGDTAAIIRSLKNIPIFSIEGDPLTFSYLERNAGLIGNIKVFNSYLGERNGIEKVGFEKEGWNTTLIPQSDSGKEVEFITLDKLLKDNVDKLNSCKLVKIDAEGYDTIILRGALRFISDVRPVICIEYNRDNMHAIKENGLSTILKMEQLGYDKVVFFDDRGRYLLSTSLSNAQLIKELSNYADGKNGLIYYYNICLFHLTDSDIAGNLIRNETERLNNMHEA